MSTRTKASAATLAACALALAVATPHAHPTWVIAAAWASWACATATVVRAERRRG